MMYLGTVGRMASIKCPTMQRVNHADRYTFSTTLGGAVKAQAGPVGKRTWDIGLGSLTTPADVGVLMEFANGAWGPGPFWFVPSDAPVVNMLTPKAAVCDPSTLTLGGGTVLLGSPPMNLGDDGVAARSVWTDGAGPVTFGSPIPVIPDSPVTGSAWIMGTGSIELSFHNASGGQVRLARSPLTTASTPQRVSTTVTPPTTAAYVILRVTQGVTETARPAVTWTDEVYEWGDGQGCQKAVVHNTTRDLTKAWRNPRTGRWSDVSFTVQEVG